MPSGRFARGVVWMADGLATAVLSGSVLMGARAAQVVVTGECASGWSPPPPRSRPPPAPGHHRMDPGAGRILATGPDDPDQVHLLTSSA
jgi:hypothetical protein